MKVLVLRKSISTSKGVRRNGDIVDLPEDEVRKRMKLRPAVFEILPVEEPKEEPKPAPKKRGRPKKRAANV